MEFGVLHQMDDYKNVSESFMDSIFKCGLLVDEHHEALQNLWDPLPPFRSDGLRSFRFIPESVKLSTTVLQCLTGDESSLVSLGIIIPATVHYLLSKLKKMEEVKYSEAFDKLTLTLHKIYELIRTVNRFHQDRLTSIGNLNNNISRALFRAIVPKLNTFLYSTAKDIVEVARKINDVIKKVNIALSTGELSNFYDVGFERINFNLPTNLPPDDVYTAFYDHCSLAYSLIVSSFLCAIGVAFCCPRESNVVMNRKKLLNEILPEASEFLCATLTKMTESFKGVYGILPHVPADTRLRLVPDKFGSINKALTEFIKKIRLIFDIAQTMHDLFLQTEYINARYTLEEFYGDIDKLFSDCQVMLTSLKKDVCRQVKIEDAEAARRREQMAQAEAAATVGEQNISESPGPSVIRHDDPDTPANTEEYNLSVHGSDDESEKEDREKPSALEYTELLECIKRQKLMIQELNSELKKRKFITQEEDSSRENKEEDSSRQDKGAAAAAAPNNPGPFNGANFFNGPLIGLAPQHNDLFPPLATTFHQAFPQPLFPEHITLPFPPNTLPQQIVLLGPVNGQPNLALPPIQPPAPQIPPIQPPAPQIPPIQPPPPPLMPNALNNFNFDEPIPYDDYENLAAQIQAAVHDNNWAGHEEVYQNEPAEEFYQNEQQNLDILYNPQNNEPAPPNNQ